MHITCPACDAVYDVPETILLRSRLMRCARCAHDFRSPLDDGPAVVSDPDMQPVFDEPAAADQGGEDAAGQEEAMPARPLPPRPELVSQAVRVQILAAWAASLAAIVIFVWLGIAYRRPVMQAWPPSARVYAALGYGHAATTVQKEP